MSAMMPISHRLFAAALRDQRENQTAESVPGFEFQVPGWRGVRSEKPVVIEVPSWIGARQAPVSPKTWSARVGI